MPVVGRRSPLGETLRRSKSLLVQQSPCWTAAGIDREGRVGVEADGEKKEQGLLGGRRPSLQVHELGNYMHRRINPQLAPCRQQSAAYGLCAPRHAATESTLQATGTDGKVPVVGAEEALRVLVLALRVNARCKLLTLPLHPWHRRGFGPRVSLQLAYCFFARYCAVGQGACVPLPRVRRTGHDASQSAEARRRRQSRRGTQTNATLAAMPNLDPRCTCEMHRLGRRARIPTTGLSFVFSSEHRAVGLTWRHEWLLGTPWPWSEEQALVLARA